MKKHFKKSEYVLAGLLALVIGFPFAVEPPAASASMSLDASVSGQTVQQKALGNYQNYRDSRRDYQKAQALCVQLRKNGKQVTCPDINDPTGITIFLSTHHNAPVVAAGSGKTIQSVGDLTPYQLNLIRWYQKVNTCPDSMKDYLPGFYQLCESLLNPNPILYRGIASPNQTSTVTTSTLDDLIKANKGVKRTW
jgi:hypothetical protein